MQIPQQRDTPGCPINYHAYGHCDEHINHCDDNNLLNYNKDTLGVVVVQVMIIAMIMMIMIIMIRTC